MNIIVCIKQVPDTAEVKIDPKSNTLIRDGVSSVLNSFDTWAIEEALRIKDITEGKVTVLTMGPPQAEAVIREAVSLGADEGILLSDPAFAGADTLATSYTLAQAIRKIGNFQLILCGKQAVDGDTAQVGPGIAAHLDIPQVVFVKKIREMSSEKIIAERLSEEGIEVVSAQLPVLISVEKGINRPRVPSLRGLVNARNYNVIIWNSKDIDVDPDRLGLKGSPTWVDKIFAPPKRSAGEIIKGPSREVVEKFLKIINDKEIM